MTRRIFTSTLVVTAGFAAAAIGMKALAGDPPVKFKQGSETTLEGRVVDLECLMTGKFATKDHAKCTADCIRAGVPAALETPGGLVLIGEGGKSPSAQLVPFAFENVKIVGKLYERDGVRYIDMTKVEKAPAKVSSATHGVTHSPKTGHGKS
jgi:hypothetical protein